MAYKLYLDHEDNTVDGKNPKYQVVQAFFHQQGERKQFKKKRRGVEFELKINVVSIVRAQHETWTCKVV